MPQASVEFDSVPPTLVEVGGVMGSPLGIHCILVYSFWGNSFQVLEDVLHIEGDVPLHLLHQLHNAHHQRAVIQEGWQSNFLHPILQCMGISHSQQQGLLSDI